MEDIKNNKTAEEQYIDIPLSELVPIDASDRAVERMARGFIAGSQAFGKRKALKEKFEEKVTKRIGMKGKMLMDKLFELAEGVSIVDKHSGKDGRTIRYYTVPPNLNAIIYMLDRVMGKPKQQTEHTEEKRGLLTVEHVIRNLASSSQQKKTNGNGDGENIIGGQGGFSLGAGDRHEGGINVRPSEVIV